MRKHLKYLKKEKGMTLVELLAVLVILGIIAAIAVPMIGNILDNTDEKGEINDALNIISAAKLAEAATTGKDNVNEYSRTELIQGGYLDSSVAKFDSVKKEVKKSSDGKTTESIDWVIIGYPFVNYEGDNYNNDEGSATEAALKNRLKDIK